MQQTKLRETGERNEVFRVDRVEMVDMTIDGSARPNGFLPCALPDVKEALDTADSGTGKFSVKMGEDEVTFGRGRSVNFGEINKALVRAGRVNEVAYLSESSGTTIYIPFASYVEENRPREIRKVVKTHYEAVE